MVVPINSGLPKMPNPPAVHVEVVEQEIPFKPLTADGMLCVVQAYPAFEDAMTALTPAEKQLAVVGHDAERIRLVPVGGFSLIQVRPPEVVLMIVEPAPVFPPFPTATQSSKLEQEMPVKSTALAGAV